MYVHSMVIMIIISYENARNIRQQSEKSIPLLVAEYHT